MPDTRNLTRDLTHVIEQGIRQGEFKPCDPEMTARLLMAPLILAVIWKQSLQPYDEPAMDMARYLDQHVELFLHGLLAAPGEGKHDDD